ncbi:gas vesicle protein G [Rhodococcus hoagii]|uniref:Gas vesicle protein G n=1 Tax=Rhodococcus hoagii TaxID=43767 RepID=A0AAE2W7U0_RHOHA|nr:gas vesicle protein GvpG [Prescottella equi]MCD7053490.1 gas vesicle protein GvpG [Rhodococcus sp. BH2-1]GBF13639.1 gas vesicle protein G [Rhodococcus sp. Br-6]AVP68907.1 gas vesicle protein G [Prescottella equi]ERN45359.1 gas vesicle protein gvpg [Prescottella equi NBRC 101255 = C 7]MBM4476518.1 gas vesicle protein G [Prescottella equi]
MGLFSAIFGLPLAPVRGVVWIGEVVRRQVEEETTSPAAMRRDLEAIEEGRRSGEISEDEAAQAEDEILHRVTRRRDAGGSGEE